MNNKQLPPLPDPNIGLPWRHNAPDGSIHSSAFTAEQMREYALQAIAQATQPAEVTDEQIESEFQRGGGKWDGNQWVIEDADIHPFARAILALRPQAVPMTDEQIESLLVNWPKDGIAFFDFARAIEAHHGITAQAKKEQA